MIEEREVESLVRRAQAGDRPAFDALAALYRPRLEALFRSRLGHGLKKQVEVADLVQETLLRAFGAFAKFRWEDEGSLPRWLWGIAVKVLFEALKRTDRNRYIALDFEVASEEPSPSRTAQRRERRERFEKALADLSPDYRTALRLVRLEGLSVAEAARHMNRTPNAVSHLLLRAVRKLGENFGVTDSLHLAEKLPPAAGSGDE